MRMIAIVFGIVMTLAAIILLANRANASFGQLGAGFGRLGGIPGSGTVAPPPVCNGSNGQIDLSFCSNAVYAAVIF